MCVALGRLFEGPNQINPPDHERPHDGDHLECLGRQVGLTRVVLTPFAGAHDMLGVGHRGWPVEALSECIPGQGSRCGMMSIDPAVDIL
jgi:hypothetical protein